MTLNEAIALLRAAGIDSAAHDAREIFSHFDGVDRATLLTRPDAVASKEAEAAILRRMKREPLQYIIGEVAFCNEVYRVSPDCLIPRSDTEILVEYAMKGIPRGERFIDLCTGSGCIAISTLCGTQDTTAVAVDISDGALRLARENAEINGVCDRISFIKADLLGENFKSPHGEYFAVLSNPPYIAGEAYAELEPELFCEPKIALVAENGGAAFYERLVPLGLSMIKENGFLAFEIGFDQAELLRRLAGENNAKIEILRDYSGNDRVAVITKGK
ncbi:MAG: peptide chain release factor N(5)-glutamine methyltransferase [Clostridia bacterium]|nr:peptide chain release factor N(5)-glutamine methyltransferase [Clostridia bacterium]